ncbi:hypothetical protein GTO91_10800 [Heliobacterium undosum]|uniref:Uncharacterized protein n=1 Tax=Heliomicrobium undosum TaxID=121734 RepID=A0A845L127_9FIRM|nr:stalk domain-containing protein [Heliomicrobium undosum]MZP30197.1 hypothetical protein [Heliomicrobium undosum]
MSRYIKSGTNPSAGQRPGRRWGGAISAAIACLLALPAWSAETGASAWAAETAPSLRSVSNSPVVESRPDITIEVNGRKLNLTPPPLLADDRTLVPLRAVGEAMGARFAWNGQTRTVEIEQDARTIRLWPDVRYISIDNKSQSIDVPPLLREDRVFVPLRLLCESFGNEVIWDGSNRTARITVKGALSGAGLAYSQSQELAVFGVRLGDGSERVRFLLGEPRRIDPGEYGFEWWVYNSDPAKLVMVGIGGGRVQAVFTAAQGVTVGGIPMDAPRTVIESRYPLKATVTAKIPEGDVQFQLSSQDLKERPLWADGEKSVVFFLDSAREGRLTGILLIDTKTMMARTQYSYQSQLWNWAKPPRTQTPAGEALQQLTRGYERQVVDITNAIRVSLKGNPVSWDEDMAVLARAHCRDMADNRFFSHDSPTKGTFAQRVERSGVPYRIAGENLAMGYVDAIQATYSWLNSPDHRENLLSSEYRSLGAGVEFGRHASGETVRYYAQEFVTRK